MHIRCWAFSLLLSAALAGCGSSHKEAAGPSTASEPQALNSNNPKPDDDATQGNVTVSEDVKKACGLSDDEAYFSFNSAAVRSKDRAILKKLADCFQTGPLKGREMRLVGHCDPRGTEDYNMALGGRRADNVKHLIVAQGLSDGKVATSSRGALDATGTDPASWAKDRNVEVQLGQ
jgi:peptidoglycan-associated lipoprotein